MRFAILAALVAVLIGGLSACRIISAIAPDLHGSGADAAAGALGGVSFEPR